LPDPALAPLVSQDEPEHEVPPRLAAMKAMGGVGTIGLEVGLSVVVGLLGGQYLDGRFGTGPWLTVLGFGFGLAAAVRSVMRQMRRMKIEAEREERRCGNPAPLWETQAERDLRVTETEREAGPSRGGASKKEPT
jgi:F0F1-type ATP synthase assembly protein I